MFSSRSFIVSGLTFRSLIHFEFIFVYGVRKCSSFILFQVVDQFSQHHLLKSLSFFHCISLPPLSKIRLDWFSYLCIQFSSVAQSCPTLCDPMNCSMPGLPVHHQLPESTQTIYIRWCHPTISSSVVPFSSCPQSFPASGSFPMSQVFASGGQIIGISASASVLPMNTQDWSPLGWTGWISLKSKGLSRVFSNTTVKYIKFSVKNRLMQKGYQLSYGRCGDSTAFRYVNIFQDLTQF